MKAGELADVTILDATVDGVAVALSPVSTPPAAPASPPRAHGFGDDEWAARLDDGRIVAFLREPVARCHLDRIAIIDGGRRREHPLPPWVYYGLPPFFAPGPRLVVGGARAAWTVEPDGTLVPLLDEPDGDGVRVCWLDADTAVAAGWRELVIDRRDARTTLPCRHAVGACVVRATTGAASAASLLVVSDDDGSHWIHERRVIARDWRPYTHAAGDLIVSSAGDAYRVFLTTP